MDSVAFRECLHHWFSLHRRSFPWRDEKSPYRVWISEVMLQQTRAAVVVPYFQRWMQLFPNVESLAAASKEKVIKAWEGLGYYTRARNLHCAAKEIVERFHGEIPSSANLLAQLPGLGLYTTGAILSFGFHQRAFAIDGNVMRLLARYFGIEVPVHSSRMRFLLEEKLSLLLDTETPWITSEALIELGALVCQKRALCHVCPLRLSCQARASDMTERLPVVKKKEPVTLLKRWVIVLESQGNLLVQKGKEGRIMADLYQFPYFTQEDLDFRSQETLIAALENAIQKQFHCKAQWVRNLPETAHSFTRFRAQLYPFSFVVREAVPVEDGSWIPKNQCALLPFSAGHRTILSNLDIIYPE
ncbi:MAG: A/G-specific adenine glycosylase [Verrucomicrobiota bacterium]|nr:A/G-specific adenine glycosylase [Verrucomicrobiota bacterium]